MKIFWKHRSKEIYSPLILMKKKKKLIICCDKFKTSNLLTIIPSPQLGFCKKTNVIYQFKWSLEDCISENNNIHVGLNLNYPIKTTHYASLWYQFNSTTSKKKKNIPAQKLILRKQYQNNKIKAKITDSQSTRD